MGECWGEVFADSENTEFLLIDIIYSSQGNNKASCKLWDGFNDAFASISLHNKTNLHRHFPQVLKLCRFFFALFTFLKRMCLVEKSSKLCSLSLIGHEIFPLWVLNRFSDIGICRTKSALCLPKWTTYGLLWLANSAPTNTFPLCFPCLFIDAKSKPYI